MSPARCEMSHSASHITWLLVTKPLECQLRQQWLKEMAQAKDAVFWDWHSPADCAVLETSNAAEMLQWRSLRSLQHCMT
jgi:hypothetical protein